MKNTYNHWPGSWPFSRGITNVTRSLVLFLIVITTGLISLHAREESFKPIRGFVENKGQIIDQDGKSNQQVKYLFSMPGLNVQLRPAGFSYDAYTMEKQPEKGGKNLSGLPYENVPEEFIYHYNRIDIEFIGANPAPQMISEEKSADYMNYYTTGTPEEGVLNVRHYGKVTYKDLYPGIDLEFIARPGSGKPVEYNFIVHPGADPRKIRWQYKGAKNVRTDGEEMVIQTIHGFLREHIPLTYEKENRKRIDLKYRTLAPDIFGFDIGSFNPQNTLVIDPVPNLQWGTYYAGSGTSFAYAGIVADATGDVYHGGITSASADVATSGAHQATLGGGNDAYFAKFSRNGALLYATYIGANGADQMNGICLDVSGNIIVGGTSSSTTAIATTGSHQSSNAGGNDGFIVKFNPGGVRLWGTFYGGSNNRDFLVKVATDGSGNILATGYSSSTSAIATVGAHQQSNGGGDDVFVVKFTSGGVRLWGTYMGGTAADFGVGLGVDASGNVFVSGSANSTSGISTAGTYQPSLSGGADGFVSKFSPNGVIQWSTYYGGPAGENGRDLIMDFSGNAVICGHTASTNGIATSGAYQTSNAGGSTDAYVAKFNTNGGIIWGTYFGGTSVDEAQDVAIDAAGNIIFTGATGSTSGIATSSAHQVSHGTGSTDAYVAKFGPNGNLQWSTYYGGSGAESGFGVVSDLLGNVYMVGNTTSPNAISTPGSYQPSRSNTTSQNIFVAKFQDVIGQNNAGTGRFTNPPKVLCAGNHDVKLEVINSGFNTLTSLNIAWEIDGVAQPPVSLSVPINSGASREITLGNVSFPINTIKRIKAWTSMPNGTVDTVRFDDTVVFSWKPGLSGNYTIGGTSADYKNFTDAANDLNAYGVCGPCNFQVNAGIYKEKVTLNQVAGSSSTNTITFIGSGKKTTILSDSGTSATSMITLLLNGTDHLTFRDMTIQNTGSTFGAAIWLTSAADSNRFINLDVFTDTVTSSANVNGIVASGGMAAISDGNTGSDLLFDSLIVVGGNHGLRLNGVNTTTSYSARNTIRNSQFMQQFQYGVYLRSQTYLLFTNNIIDTLRSATSSNLTIEYSSNLEVANNIVKSKDIGLNMFNINRNLYNSSYTSRIFNNMISSTTDYAFQCNTASALKIWHNSFNADAGTSVVRFLSGATIDVRNNHIVNRNSSQSQYVLMVDNISAFSALNFNNYFSPGGFVFVGSVHYANIPVLQAAFSNLNTTCYNQNPSFISNTDLHTSVNISGVYVGIDRDIDNDFRNLVAPVLGADEVNIPNNVGVSQLITPAPVFCAGIQDVSVKIANYGINVVDSVKVYWEIDGVPQPMANIVSTIGIRGFYDITLGSISFSSTQTRIIKVWTSMPNGVIDSLRNNDTLLIKMTTGMSGTYTIGGTTPDFLNFTEAVNSLTILGVCGPVVFDVRPGAYEERLNIPSIKGTSALNTVTFKGSAALNSNLFASGNNTSNWATLVLDGADHIIFRDMNISATGPNFGIGVILTNQADSNAFINVKVETSSTSASLNLVGIAVISNPTDLYALPGQPGDGNIFDSITMNGGYYGIYLTGNSSRQSITNSKFSSQYVSSVFCSAQDYIKVAYNKFNPLRDSTFSYALNFTQSSNLDVHSNFISARGEFGMYINYSNVLGRDPAFHSRIYNNMVYNIVGYAFYCENSEMIGIYHNSFRSVGSSSNISAAVYFAGTAGIDLRNNQIRNDNANSVSLYADGISAFDTCDYNNYFSFGSFVRMGSVYSSLSNLKASIPQFNQNSYSQDPQFLGLSDLHTSFFLPGIYLGIDWDIDGEARCPQRVSVGADDENQGFAKPVISTSHTAFFTKYPIDFLINIAGEPSTTFKWYVDGHYMTDSSALKDTFNTAGTYKIKLEAQRCIYRDSAEFTLVVVSGSDIITLNGKNPDSSRVFNSYTDPGVMATDFLGKDISGRVISGGMIDTSVLGSYYIWYVVEDDWGNKDSVTREVLIMDDVAPQLVLIGLDTLTIEVFGSINDPGITITDNYDLSLTGVVDSSFVDKNNVGIYRMIYTVMDNSGNKSQIVRWVKVLDTERPQIVLSGPDTVKVDVFGLYIEMGARVSDNYCKSGLNWEVDAYPSTNVLGDIVLTYTALDCQGNSAIPVTRVIRVVDRQRPEIELNGFANVNHVRWAPYTDAGITINDNYYASNDLEPLVQITSNLDTNEAGTYSVCYQVTDPSGNKSTKVCRSVTVKESITSVNAATLQENVKVYPNPSNGMFTLDFSGNLSETALVIVLDMTGKEVFRTTVNTQQTLLQPDNLSAGIYQVVVQQGEERAVLRINIIK